MMNRTDFRITVLRFFSLLAIFAIILPFPLNDDNAHWQSMAFDFLHYGRWPYVGSWDQSFPGILLVHIPAILLFGPSDLGFRIFDVLVQLGFCAVLYRLWRLYLPQSTAWMAVLFYAFYYARSAPGIGGERDVYASLLVLAGAYLLLRMQGIGYRVQGIVTDRLPEIFGGLSIGFAALIRPTYGVYLLPLIAFIPAIRNIRSALIIGVSSLLPLALSYAIYAIKPGGLDAYWTATVLFNRDTYIQIARPFGNFWWHLVSPKLLIMPAGLWLAVCGVWRAFRSPRTGEREARPTPPIWLYVSFIALTLALVLIQRKYYGYHFALYGMLLTPLAALGMERVLQYLPSRIRMPLFFIVFWILSMPLEMLTRYAIPAASNGRPMQGITAALHATVWEDTAEDRVLDYFRQPQHRDGLVEVCSFDPRLRMHLLRGPAGIYASLHPLGFRTDLNNPNAFTNYQLLWRRAYLDSLTQQRPRYIVIARASFAEYLTDPYTSTLHTISGFDSLLQKDYKLDTTIGANEIYCLNL